MDGFFQGNTYEQMDDLGGPPLFLETPIRWLVLFGDCLVLIYCLGFKKHWLRWFIWVGFSLGSFDWVYRLLGLFAWFVWLVALFGWLLCLGWLIVCFCEEQTVCELCGSLGASCCWCREPLRIEHELAICYNAGSPVDDVDVGWRGFFTHLFLSHENKNLGPWLLVGEK